MRKKTKPGDLIKIPYQNEWHVYGRVLEDESYAIYDFPSRLNDSNYDQIIQPLQVVKGIAKRIS